MPDTGQTFLFGVMNNDGKHYDNEWQRGVRATTFEFHWDLYEPQEGSFDPDYIQHMKDILAQLKSKGWFIQMIPGLQYTPEWVFRNCPDTYYVDQYGDRYSPDRQAYSSFQVINAPFNPHARALIESYLDRIFEDFDQANPQQHFDAIRVGGGVMGELRYPPGDWNGHVNSFWAFDVNAQAPITSGIPAQAAGWRPGIDANPGSVGRGQLIVNPGFEDTFPGFQVYGWTPDDQVNTEIITQGVRSGTNAVRLTITSPNRMHQYVRITPGATYSFGGWLKTASANSQGRLFLTQFTNKLEPVPGATFLKLSSNNPDWSQQSATLVTSTDTAYVKVEMDGDGPGDYYFDDLWLKRDGETDNRSRDISIPAVFYTWYIHKLTDFQNWQIAQIREHSDAQLDLTYPGKGLQAGAIMDALVDELRQESPSSGGGALYAGTYYPGHIAGLTEIHNVAVYLTGIDDPPENIVDDHSPYPGQWSAARWLSSLAKSRGLLIWGENSGGDTLKVLQLSVSRMLEDDFIGLMWGFESELYASSGSYATIQDYSRVIHQYQQIYSNYLPVCGK